MTTKPKISIITSTRYRPDLLARAIKSVQYSTLKDYEHIIVSDHCPKARYVYEIFKEDKRIKFFELESPHLTNRGSYGRNMAIEKSKSDFITYLDDDNIVMANHLEMMYKSLSTGKYDLVHTKTHEVGMGKGDNTIETILSRNLHEDLDPEIYVRHDLKYSDPLDTSNAGHTKYIIEQIGGWTPSPQCNKTNGSEDSDLFRRLHRATEGRRLDVPIYTSVYYARWGCIRPDTVYHNKVSSLDKKDVFAFPELLKKTGVL